MELYLILGVFTYILRQTNEYAYFTRRVHLLPVYHVKRRCYAILISLDGHWQKSLHFTHKSASSCMREGTVLGSLHQQPRKQPPSTCKGKLTRDNNFHPQTSIHSGKFYLYDYLNRGMNNLLFLVLQSALRSSSASIIRCPPIFLLSFSSLLSFFFAS